MAGARKHRGKSGVTGESDRKTIRKIRKAREKQERRGIKYGRKKQSAGLIPIVAMGRDPWVPRITNADLGKLQRGKSVHVKDYRYDVDLDLSALPMVVFVRLTGKNGPAGVYKIDLTKAPGTIERRSNEGKTLRPQTVEKKKIEEPAKPAKPRQTDRRLRIPRLARKDFLRLEAWGDVEKGNWTLKPDRLNYSAPSDSGVVYFRAFYDIQNTLGQYQDRGLFRLDFKRNILSEVKEG